MVMKAFNEFLVGMFGSRNERVVKSYMQMAMAAGELEEQTKALSDEELKAKTAAFKETLKDDPDAEHILTEAFAVVREAARRNMECSWSAAMCCSRARLPRWRPVRAKRWWRHWPPIWSI
jgi:preprotein translocase subunit SecA